MSHRVTRLAWEYPIGGAAKLALMALADWADDQGERLYPSMSAIAGRMCCSVDHARRAVHALIDLGVLHVVGNATGGAPGSTRRYRIDVDRLTTGVDARGTPCIDATPTPGADASPTAGTESRTGTESRAGAGAADGLHRRGRRLAPVQANPLLAVNNRERSDSERAKTSPTREGALSARLRAAGVRITPMHPTLLAWIDAGVTDEQIDEALQRAIDRKGDQAIPAGYLDPIVRDVMNPPERPEGRPKRNGGAWWADERSTIAKGRELGIEARPGEDMPNFQQRIRDAIARNGSARNG